MTNVSVDLLLIYALFLKENMVIGVQLSASILCLSLDVTSEDEVQCTKTVPSSKQKAMKDTSTSSKSKHAKVTSNISGPVTHFENEITTQSNHQSFLEVLKSKVFSRDSVSLNVEGCGFWTFLGRSP